MIWFAFVMAFAWAEPEFVRRPHPMPRVLVSYCNRKTLAGCGP